MLSAFNSKFNAETTKIIKANWLADDETMMVCENIQSTAI